MLGACGTLESANKLCSFIFFMSNLLLTHLLICFYIMYVLVLKQSFGFFGDSSHLVMLSTLSPIFSDILITFILKSVSDNSKVWVTELVSSSCFFFFFLLVLFLCMPGHFSLKGQKLCMKSSRNSELCYLPLERVTLSCNSH